MNSVIAVLARFLMIGGICLPAWAFAGVGADTAADMTKRYADAAAGCGPDMKRPAFECSGILLRGTAPSKNYHAWNPSPGSVARGGVSVSFLRVDAEFNQLAYNYLNGFTFYDAVSNPAGKEWVSVLCSFAVDAATGVRDQKGCGKNTVKPVLSQACQLQNIFTAEQWLVNFKATGTQNQCGFDLQGDNPAQAFNETLRATNLISAQSFKMDNELIVATWPQDIPERLPIQSFFYLKGGLPGAQYDQVDFYKSTGLFVPVINIALPATRAADAVFTYNNADQVVPEGNSSTKTCERYIESAKWLFQNNLWSLSIVPSECGRAIGEDQTAFAFYELFSTYAGDPKWTNTRSARNQFVCLLATARDKPQWNIEPSRPDVGYAATLKAACNP